MNIVHVVESLEIGGLEHVVLALAKAQQQRGHAVRIVCLWRLGPLAQQAVDAGIEVACVDKRAGLDVRALLRLRSALREAGAEVLHSHNPMAHYYAVAASRYLRLGCVINTRHGMGRDGSQSRTERLYRWALRASDFAVSVCEAAQRRFVARGSIPAAKAVVVRNGIDLSRFIVRNASAAAQLKATLALPHDAVLFGTVGRLNEAKQHGLLLRAFARLRESGTRAALVIVGDGELRGALESERDLLGLQDSVRLVGARSDVPDLLAALDVFVLSSRTEGYSLALVEASAAGLPIIATDVGGNAEIVRHDVSGIVVPSGDLDGLKQAMASLAADAPRRAALGEQARSWALREGTLDAMVEHYLGLYGKRVRPDTTRARVAPASANRPS